MEERKHIIEPRIQKNNKILFVGINPVEGSFQNGYYHYFSNNSYFYTLLKEAGFTKEKENDLGLKKYNYGIINYCNYIAKTPKEIPKEELEKARLTFIEILNKYIPDNIIFLGKLIPKIFFKTIDNKRLYDYKNEFGKKYIGINSIFNDIKFCFNWYVVPFPSNFMIKKEKVNIYKEVLKQI